MAEWLSDWSMNSCGQWPQAEQQYNATAEPFESPCGIISLQQIRQARARMVYNSGSCTLYRIMTHDTGICITSLVCLCPVAATAHSGFVLHSFNWPIILPWRVDRTSFMFWWSWEGLSLQYLTRERDIYILWRPLKLLGRVIFSLLCSASSGTHTYSSQSRKEWELPNPCRFSQGFQEAVFPTVPVRSLFSRPWMCSMVDHVVSQNVLLAVLEASSSSFCIFQRVTYG